MADILEFRKLARKEIRPQAPERFIRACWNQVRYQERAQGFIFEASLQFIEEKIGPFDGKMYDDVCQRVRYMVNLAINNVYVRPEAYVKDLYQFSKDLQGNSGD
ncbi:hypothetical protein C4585_00275 [Candidatus Parcubacteria bacterium]|nr:MAG: hypothetical protein C4585_00275 [Candidatus Parcubacteria bacterium]